MSRKLCMQAIEKSVDIDHAVTWIMDKIPSSSEKPSGLESSETEMSDNSTDDRTVAASSSALSAAETSSPTRTQDMACIICFANERRIAFMPCEYNVQVLLLTICRWAYGEL